MYATQDKNFVWHFYFGAMLSVNFRFRVWGGRIYTVAHLRMYKHGLFGFLSIAGTRKSVHTRRSPNLMLMRFGPNSNKRMSFNYLFFTIKL